MQSDRIKYQYWHFELPIKVVLISLSTGNMWELVRKAKSQGHPSPY